MKLPANYESMSFTQRSNVRDQYVILQVGLCFYCKEPLNNRAPERITKKKINWGLFPPYFLKYPVHLQHDHKTGLTEGAVHAYCNAVMWQYEGR